MPQQGHIASIHVSEPQNLKNLLVQVNTKNAATCTRPSQQTQPKSDTVLIYHLAGPVRQAQPYLVIIGQLLSSRNVPLGTDDDVLVTIEGHNFCEAVGSTAVIDESSQTALHKQSSSLGSHPEWPSRHVAFGRSCGCSIILVPKLYRVTSQHFLVLLGDAK